MFGSQPPPRAEVFNAINYSNSAPLSCNIFNSTGAAPADAWRIRSTMTRAQQIQFDVKFNF